MEPLLDRIARDPTTVVCPVIDVIDDTTLEYHYHDSSGVNVGGFDWNLQFNWHPVPEREKKRHKNTAEPVYSPTMAGGLFSIDRVSFKLKVIKSVYSENMKRFLKVKKYALFVKEILHQSKVSRETGEIISLKKLQEANYWDMANTYLHMRPLKLEFKLQKMLFTFEYVNRLTKPVSVSTP